MHGTGNPMRAYVSNDLGLMGTSIALVRRRYLNGLEVVELAQPVELEWAELDPAVYHGHTLRVPDSMARAMLDGLSSYYGGTTDVRSLRKDYDAERGSVDRLLDELAKTAAAGRVVNTRGDL